MDAPSSAPSESYRVSMTRRYTNDNAEALLYNPQRVGGHSTIELVDYMGGSDMVERVATAGHGRSIFPENPSQQDFMHFLVGRGIHTPFKSVQLKFGIQAPILTALSFVYDPQANVNEYSGRYSKMLETSWVPSHDSIVGLLSDHDSDRASHIRQLFIDNRQQALERYGGLLSTEFARELARSGLGIDNDTRFFWKMDLTSLAQFVDRERKRLRIDDPTRQCVEKIDEMARSVGGAAWDALMNYSYSEFPLTFPRDNNVVDKPLTAPAWEPRFTRRVCVPSLEKFLFVSRPVLDHGAFQSVDYMGDDSCIAEAARTSYGKGTRKLQEDGKLIHSLARDGHTTPLEMTELAIECTAPLFTDPRQAGRHRTLAHHGFMGYFPVGDTFYTPEDIHFKYQDRLNRQGRGKDMDEGDKVMAKSLLSGTFKGQVDFVNRLRVLEAPEEVVRAAKGVGFFTRVWRTGDAHNWGKFLGLRLDAHAQYEVRQYAREVDNALALQLPITHEAIHAYMVDAIRLSTRDFDLIRRANLLDKSVDINDPRVYEPLGLTVPVDRADPSKGITFSREAESLRRKLSNLRD